VPVLDARGVISHGIVCVGLVEQLDHARAVALAQDMKQAAEMIAAQTMPA
jgi:DNA-binding IclR family transcriptional regulator